MKIPVWAICWLSKLKRPHFGLQVSTRGPVWKPSIAARTLRVRGLAQWRCTAADFFAMWHPLGDVSFLQLWMSHVQIWGEASFSNYGSFDGLLHGIRALCVCEGGLSHIWKETILWPNPCCRSVCFMALFFRHFFVFVEDSQQWICGFASCLRGL